MGFWRSHAGAVVLSLLLAILAGVGAVGIQVYRVTHPPRTSASESDVSNLLVHGEEVRFRSVDGVELSGTLIRGAVDRPAILLCHDLGESGAALLSLAIPLQKDGFTLLALDFRSHGKSGESLTTLGIVEKRDVLAAVDYLASLPEVDNRRIGIYGTGMGAHAAALAAAERPALRVLVLDGLYPDVGYALVRKVYSGWPFGVRNLGFLPVAVFDLLNRTSLATERAADVLPRLAGKDVLLVAPAGDLALSLEMEAMVRTIPHQPNTEGNLVTLAATTSAGLYGSELARYQERLTQFFESRLVVK